jgi:hypothetical protein
MSNLMSTAASIKLLKKTLILLPQHIYCAMNSTIIRPQAQPNFINRNHNILVCKLPLISSQLLVQSASHAHNIGQSEPAPMTAPVGRSVHRMGWMIRLFFIHLFTLH